MFSLWVPCPNPVDNTLKADIMARHYEKISSDSNLDPNYLENKNREKQEIRTHGPKCPCKRCLFKPHNTQQAKSKAYYNKNLTLSELEKTINSKKDSAPGFDGITYSMLKHLPKSGKKQLLHMFN